jgi:hypothetical protein
MSKIAAVLTVLLIFSFGGGNTAFADSLRLGPGDRIPGTNTTVWGPNSFPVMVGAGVSGRGATVSNLNDFNVVLGFVLDGTLPSEFVIDLASGGIWNNQEMGTKIIEFTGDTDSVTVWGNAANINSANFILKNGTFSLVSVNLVGTGEGTAFTVYPEARLNLRTGSSIQNYDIGIFSQGTVNMQNLGSPTTITNTRTASVINDGGVFSTQSSMTITGDITH